MLETQTLDERIAEAQRDSEQLNGQLANTEAQLEAALAAKDYAAADQLQRACDDLRQPALIAQATLDALVVASTALQTQQADQEQRARERAHRDQADAQHEAAKARAAEALQDVQRYLAEIGPAYSALVEVLHDALDAEKRQGQARRDAHLAGQAAGHIDPQLPAPVFPNTVEVRIASEDILAWILRQPRLTR